jgi:dihydropteroate synthase
VPGELGADVRRAERVNQVLEEARSRRGVALMGICNVTPDSFSDGGQFLDFEAATARVDALVAEGADIVDLGAESTRPGATPVPPQEQLTRVLEVVRYAQARACVSIDTTSPEVAAACLDAGACMVNDVSLLADLGLAKVVAASGAAIVLMHSRGPMEKMRAFGEYPDEGYGDVVRDVLAEWSRAAEGARAAGVAADALLMDPGLGFAKNARQSAELLRRTGELVRAAGVPVLVGASRKSFLETLAGLEGDARPDARLGASLAAALFAARAGASVLRVHDVRATAQLIDASRALLVQEGDA